MMYPWLSPSAGIAVGWGGRRRRRRKTIAVGGDYKTHYNQSRGRRRGGGGAIAIALRGARGGMIPPSASAKGGGDCTGRKAESDDAGLLTTGTRGGEIVDIVGGAIAAEFEDSGATALTVPVVDGRPQPGGVGGGGWRKTTITTERARPRAGRNARGGEWIEASTARSRPPHSPVPRPPS